MMKVCCRAFSSSFCEGIGANWVCSQGKGEEDVDEETVGPLNAR